MESLVAFLPYVSAGFSVLSGLSGFASGQQNAAYAEADAKQSMINARAEADRQRRLVAIQQSQLRADVGAQGTTFSGSPMEVYLANAKAGEMEAQDKIYAGKLKKRSLLAQADIYRNQGYGSLFGGFAGAAGSLAKVGGGGAASSAAPSWTSGYDAWDSGGF
jgi:hypothetical protein